jgi:hypothetical protein
MEVATQEHTIDDKSSVLTIRIILKKELVWQNWTDA